MPAQYYTAESEELILQTLLHLLPLPALPSYCSTRSPQVGLLRRLQLLIFMSSLAKKDFGR